MRQLSQKLIVLAGPGHGTGTSVWNIQIITIK